MGSDVRMSYTVIGDNVNLTSRVESADKFYGTSVLITEPTYQQVKEHFVTRLFDYTVLAGKAIPIRLYELACNNSTVSAERLEQIEDYQRAFHLYSQRQFAEAVVTLEQLIRNAPEDRVPRLLLARCQLYMTTPPVADWQGDYLLPSK